MSLVCIIEYISVIGTGAVGVGGAYRLRLYSFFTIVATYE